jgi:putative transposase
MIPMIKALLYLIKSHRAEGLLSSIRNSFDVHSGKKRKGALILSKLGHIEMVMHRPLTAIPKTATVKRTQTGKCFVIITVESEQGASPLPPLEEQVGIVVDLKTFA